MVKKSLDSVLGSCREAEQLRLILLLSDLNSAEPIHYIECVEVRTLKERATGEWQRELDLIRT